LPLPLFSFHGPSNGGEKVSLLNVFSTEENPAFIESACAVSLLIHFVGLEIVRSIT